MDTCFSRVLVAEAVIKKQTSLGSTYSRQPKELRTQSLGALSSANCSAAPENTAWLGSLAADPFSQMFSDRRFLISLKPPAIEKLSCESPVASSSKFSNRQTDRDETQVVSKS